ncbi:uncharacterized protein FMAN_00065 [Fusarium mangiferae]|uniref:Uncharacterized protein n=1 Tax=Fusarium mangiferae TaxID=192010 RepID=A0A1L7U4X9_FUSMA|nr:uncharacterized protein FMAN_00065 [Fusarium mangiferae]CVL02561.1 uncharacterized protein FMAN_00065 [Fusarium mangiferae]
MSSRDEPVPNIVLSDVQNSIPKDERYTWQFLTKLLWTFSFVICINIGGNASICSLYDH